MKRFALMAAALTLAVCNLAAGQTREDLDAMAALALQSSPSPKAVAAPAPKRMPVGPHKPDVARPLTLDEAKAVTRERHVPVLVRVGAIDCSKLCERLRPELPTCHTDELGGDRTPRLQIIMADRNGEIWWSQERWTWIPTESDVRTIAAKVKAYVEQPAPVYAVPADSCPTGNCWRR